MCGCLISSSGASNLIEQAKASIATAPGDLFPNGPHRSRHGWPGSQSSEIDACAVSSFPYQSETRQVTKLVVVSLTVFSVPLSLSQ